MAEVMNPQGHGGELGVLSFFDPDESDAKSTQTMARRAFFALMALGFVFGASGPVLFHGAEVSSGDVQTLLGHLGALAASVLISSLVILAFPRRADFTVVFQATFTLVVTASLALPFVGTWYLGAYNVVVEVVFRVVSLLVAYLCTTVRGNRMFCRTVPFLLISSNIGLTVGVAFGDALYRTVPNGSVALVVITLSVLYVMFMVLSLGLGGRLKSLASPRDGFSQGDEAALRSNMRADAEAVVAGLYGLSEREASVMAYLAKGRSIAFAAEKLSLSQNTVKTYAKTLYKKLGVHSRQELMDLLDAHGEASQPQE